MSKKIRVKLIMRLAESGMSQNAIARLHHISKRSISDVLGIAKENGIAFGDVADLTDEEAYRRFYPDKHAHEVLYRQPDYAHIHEELKRAGACRKALEHLHSPRYRHLKAILSSPASQSIEMASVYDR